MSIDSLLVRLIELFWMGCNTFFAHNIKIATITITKSDRIYNNQSSCAFIVGVLLCNNLVDGGGGNNLTHGKSGDIK